MSTERSGNRKRPNQDGVVTPNRKLKEARPLDAYVYLLGFTENEIEKLTRNQPSCLVFRKNITSDLSHVVVKSNCAHTLKSSWDWNPIFFAIISGSWLLRPEWLTKCREAGKITAELPHVYKTQSIDVPKSVPSKFDLRSMIILYNKMEIRRRDKGDVLFANEVFQHVVVVSGRSSLSRLRKQQLKLIMGASGAKFEPDDAFRTICESHRRAEKNVSCIIYILSSGETREDLKIDESFVKSMLKLRIAIMDDEFIYLTIQNMLPADRNGLMVESVVKWKNIFKWNIPPNVYDYMTGCDLGMVVLAEWDERAAPPRRSTNSSRSRESSLLLQGVEDTIFSNTRSSPLNTDSKSGKGKQMEKDLALSNAQNVGNTNDLTEEKLQKCSPIKTVQFEDKFASTGETGMDKYLGSDDLLGEALTEIKQTEDEDLIQDFDNYEIPPPIVFMQGNFENEITTEHNYGMKSFSFSSGRVPDDVLSLLTKPSDWMDTVPHLSIFIPEALAKTGLDSCNQSGDSLFYFNELWKCLEKYTPTDMLHDTVCKDLVAWIRNSGHKRFCPVESVMSKLFNDIGKPAYGMNFDADQSVFRLINSLLRTFPPSNTGGRYYWLQVLSELPSAISTTHRSKISKKISKETDSEKKERELTIRTTTFRKMIIDSFIGDGTSLMMQELLVNVLEADLFGLLAEGQKESKMESEKRRSLGRVPINGFSDDLKDVPLAYLVFYEANDKRKRGLTIDAQTTVLKIVDFVKEHEHEPSVRAVVIRLLCVLLEALRWFCSQVAQVFEGKDISYELQTDLRRIGRQFTKNGFSEVEVLEMLPLDWVHKHIFVDC